MTLKCFSAEVNLTPENRFPIIELYNPVNCNVSYRWEIQDKNFVISPESGFIIPRNSVKCTVGYIPQAGAVLRTEIYLISQSLAKQIVKVTCHNEQATLQYQNTLIHFENIPLNTIETRIVVVRNASNRNVVLEVVDPNPMKEISVTPISTLVRAMSNVIFKITAHFKAVMKFNTKIILRQQDVYEQALSITGYVAYPHIMFQPNSIQFTKIPSWSCRYGSMHITNNGETKNTLDFDLRDYSGVSVVDTNFNGLDTVILEPKQSLQLYLKFHPKEPTVFSFIIPHMINGLIGPSLLNDPKSLESSTFYQYSIESTPQENIVSNSLSVVKAKCTSGIPWIIFSSLNIQFEYSGKSEIKIFTLQNVYNVEFVVYLHIGHIGDEFNISLNQSGLKARTTNIFHKVFLEPQQKVEFAITFSPKDFGEFAAVIPIAVDLYRKDEPFNYLYLSGLYPRSEIKNCVKVICFQTIPINTSSSTTSHLQFLNHWNECKFAPVSTYNNFTCEAKKKKKDTSSGYLCYEFTIHYRPTQEENQSFDMEFSCSCGASFKILVIASADKASFLNYLCPLTEKAVSLTGNVFPFQIVGSTKASVAISTVIAALENWMFNECFFGLEQYLIPDTISKYAFAVYCPESKVKFGSNKKKRIIHPPIVQLIVNLVDRSVLQCLIRG